MSKKAIETHRAKPLADLCEEMTEAGRQRADLVRAMNRLILQAKATCRRYCDGDKKAGTELYKSVSAGEPHPIAAHLAPYLLAMEPLATWRAKLEKQLRSMARALPVWDAWAGQVKGLGDLNLALIVGEAGNPDNYQSHRQLIKRMGCAVIDGERQRRVGGDPEANLIHGYNPSRRSIVWNACECLIKGNGDGPYRSFYLLRKEYESGKQPESDGGRPAIWHNRAHRRLGAMILTHLFHAWRGSEPRFEAAPLCALEEAA